MKNTFNKVVQQIVKQENEQTLKRIVGIVKRTSITQVEDETTTQYTLRNANNPYLQDVYVQFTKSDGSINTMRYPNKSGEFVYTNDRVYVEYWGNLSNGYIAQRIFGRIKDVDLYSGVTGDVNKTNNKPVQPATYTDAGVVIIDKETMTVDSTGKISVKKTGSTSHPDIATSVPTIDTTPDNLSAGDIFAAVTNITRDNNGHVKTFDVKTFKLLSNDIKAVFTGASNGTSAGTNLPNGHVYFNLVLNDKIVSGHKISGANGAEVTTDENGDIVIGAKANTKNVIAPAPNVPVDIFSDNADVYLNHVVGGGIASSHLITGTGGTKVLSHSSGTNNFDGVIDIKSSCANTGTLTHSEQNMTIDTGFAETPKIFVLYCNYNDEIVQAAKCRPGLIAPFDCVLNANLPIASVDFDGGTVTVNCHTSTGLMFAWEAYI